MKTLSLDTNWDIHTDNYGNIAIIDGNERLAQDVASSVRVFKGELPFDVDRGVEYDKPDEIRETLNYEMNEQAKLVSGVEESSVIFENLNNRELSAVVYITNKDGEKIKVE